MLVPTAALETPVETPVVTPAMTPVVTLVVTLVVMPVVTLVVQPGAVLPLREEHPGFGKDPAGTVPARTLWT